jgi:uncharacterized protein (TIGR02996 family)
MRQAFEDALVADPDDCANHPAYADWLSEQDDEKDRARGELVAVQLALEDEGLPSSERQRLRRREAELLSAHERAWLGELAPFLLDGEMNTCDASMWGFDGRSPVFADTRPRWLPDGEAWDGNPVVRPTFTYRYGWLDSLHLPHLSIHLARALKHAPQARLLRQLMIDEVAERSNGVSPEDEVPGREYSVGLCPLTKATSLASVRTFRLGPDDGDDYRNYRCYTHTGAVVGAVRQMPRLEELRLFANGFDLNELFRSSALSQLRVLQVYHAQQVHRLQLLTEGPAMSNLTHLLLHPHHVGSWGQYNHSDNVDGYNGREGFLPLSVVAPLLRSPNLPRLQHLRLRCSSMGNAGCREIVASGILKRLKTLDLRHGAITDEGARALAECPLVRNLTWLDLDRNRLNADGIARLKRIGIPLRLDDQQSQRDRRTWPQYLSEGEWE